MPTAVTNVKLVKGRVVAETTADPLTEELTYENESSVQVALPVGSVVRNTTTGQKFIKKAVGYLAIAQTLDPALGLGEAGDIAWALLQDL